MWNDLETGASALLENPIIRHLASGAVDQFPDQGQFPVAERLDQERRPVDTYCPLDADSTQLAAVFAAEHGKSFVLEGPPGTGKSQTITNLICQCLAGGKTVLFVSEKMAALEVVQRRLNAVGVGEFCLELHSNKAHKRDVLDKLGRSWDALGATSPDDWSDRASRLEKQRASLNEVVAALHERKALGISVFQAMSQLIGLRDQPRVALSFGSPREFTGTKLHELHDTAARLQTAAQAIETVAGHPWRDVGWDDWTPGKHETVIAAVRALDAAAERFSSSVPACAAALQSDPGQTSRAALRLRAELVRTLLASPGPPQGLLAVESWTDTRAEIDRWVAHGQERDQLHGRLAARYDVPRLAALDLADLRRRFGHWCTAFFLIAFFLLFFARRTLKRVVRPGERLPSNRTIAEELEAADKLRGEEEFLTKVDPEAKQRLGRMWVAAREESKWEPVARVTAWAEELRRLVDRYLAFVSSAVDVDGSRTRLLALAGETSPVMIAGSPARRALEDYSEAFERYEEAYRSVLDMLQIDPTRDWLSEDAQSHLELVRNHVATWLGAEKRLRDWCHYSSARKAALSARLAPLVDAIGSGTVGADRITLSLERSVLEWWTQGMIEGDQTLRTFHSAEHARTVDAFRDLDVELRKLSPQLVRARLATRLPDPSGGAVGSSELGILQREIQKKKRHLPVRKLFAKIPQLLRRLKPCLLMSPLSVAQYLGTDFSSFDLVVFDEASQIPTHDAIGAVGRGRQLVVVGDTKQLPPTTFFARMEADDEHVPDEDDIDELESILNECQAAGLPRLRLGWHYRSRHESLITFSNFHYYDNALNTFPSARSSREKVGVSWQHLPSALYDKGKSRTNRGEAEAVVAEIVRRLLDPLDHHLSIGVVTFSQAQQRLIEDLLDEERRRHPEIEPFFGNQVDEPLFVKNLENVQGDERDVILFSVCYGPDETGAVSMNFGPLNRTGGERRLNVAITRARCQLVVYSGLRADQIDVSRTRALGARHLKTFLDYAARGPKAIAEASTPGVTDFDSPFEREVHRALVEKGWDVHIQVGCSAYRIDLAVVDPERPGRYLLGIECDGASYHSAKTARDRDRLRAEVLRSLGWKLHRVWSTDWWHDPERELARIEEALEKVRREPVDGVVSGAWSVVKSAPAEVPERPVAKSGRASKSGAPSASFPPAAASKPPENAVRYASVAPRISGNPDDLFSESRARKMRLELLSIVRIEAPIHLQVLTRRIAGALGVKRTSQRMTARVRELIESAPNPVPKIVDDFVWRADQNPDIYDQFRLSAEDDSEPRKIAEIALQEIAAAAYPVVAQNVALGMDELVHEVAHLLGIARVGQNVAGRIEEGIELLAKCKKCVIENRRIKLP